MAKAKATAKNLIIVFSIKMYPLMKRKRPCSWTLVRDRCEPAPGGEKPARQATMGE